MPQPTCTSYQHEPPPPCNYYDKAVGEGTRLLGQESDDDEHFCRMTWPSTMSSFLVFLLVVIIPSLMAVMSSSLIVKNNMLLMNDLVLANGKTTPTVSSKLDKAHTFTVEQCIDMMYTNGANAKIDRPNHLRAASSMQWIISNDETTASQQRMAILQDDMNFIALVDIELTFSHDTNAQQQQVDDYYYSLQIQHAYSIALPSAYHYRQFHKSRGNKNRKLDLEAAIYVPEEHSPFGEGFLLSFGSGSFYNVRDVIILVGDSLLRATSDVNIDFQAVNGTFWNEYCGKKTNKKPSKLIAFYAPAFFQSLRTHTEFSGSELNIEGAAFIPPSKASPAKIRFFQRGNGAAAAATNLRPRSATGEVVANELFRHLDSLLVIDGHAPLFYPKSSTVVEQPLPKISDIIEYNLGSVEGVNLTFTGSAPAVLSVNQNVERTKFVYIAGAEASPDATRDGDVVGTAMGIIHSIDFTSESKKDFELGSYNFLTYPNGTKFLQKTEGVTIIPSGGLSQQQTSHGLALTVLDMDDPIVASQMCVVRMKRSTTSP